MPQSKEGEVGLRERQRRQRRQRILDVAGDLFTEVGFDAGSMEEIAARAEISVPTIYGYFRSKSDLLLGLLEADYDIVQPKVASILSEAAADLKRPALEWILKLVLVGTTEGYDLAKKRVWREIAAAAYRGPDEQRQAFMAAQNARVDAFKLLLQMLKERGDLRKDLNCEVAAQTIQAIARNGFRLYLMQENATLVELAAQMRQQVSLLLLGMENAGVTAKSGAASDRGTQSIRTSQKPSSSRAR